MNFARVSGSSGSICSGRMRSIKMSLERSDMAARRVRRIAMASLSSQSWITPFNTYASAAVQKVRLAEDAWNSRDPKRVTAPQVGALDPVEREQGTLDTADLAQCLGEPVLARIGR